ncbi:hypothetical protein D1BOALGB6SA_5579 [Olavius sp. associated proteobacterium Delta 1]|nr:hypothetical protein D1BOALGB6SA_5579 [Olavius sp. associated proteobacterium Delta 1]
MESDDINLDDSAEELYAQLGGVEVRKLEKHDFSGSDRLEQGLREERRRYDALRIQIGNLVYQVSRCLDGGSKACKQDLERMILVQFENIFGSLSINPEVGNKTLIRYKGAFGGNLVDKKTDYEILSGDISFDTEVVRAISKGQGTDPSKFLEKLNRGFETFWNHSINNLILKIPQNRQELKRLLVSLQFAARYFTAIEKNSPITISMRGKPVSLPPIHNENNVPDLNLTLLAVLNGLHPQKMQAMVHKVDSLMRSTESNAKKYSYTSIYDAILKIKRFRSKLNPSPIEVNNIKWLMVSDGQAPVSDQMANVARLVMDSSGGSSTETARVLKSVYGEDYAKIDSQQIAERLHLTSGLLETIDTKSKGAEIKTEVLNNMEERLSKVNENVYDNLQIEGNEIKAYTPGKGTLTEKVHTKIGKIVTFQKNRSETKKKMTQMVHRVIKFDVRDFETLAEDFKVSVDQAKTLVKMLKSCFDSQGNFSKSTFGRIIPDLERYERRIFDFLWHNLKESLHQNDRSAFLDSLQLLVDRLKQPKNSLSVLLEDLFQNPSVIRFADRKAFMLGNRLVRSYSQEIVSYQITPEDVLLTNKGIDQKITRYAAWKIDKNQDKFFEKIGTIHRRLLEDLDSDEDQNSLMDVQELLALERESYIFMALVGGNTSRSILLSALKEYGHPESDLYQLSKSQKHMADILQLLKVVIRGVGKVGDSNEVAFIEGIKGRLDVFSQLTNSLHETDLINQLKESADSAKQKLMAKT